MLQFLSGNVRSAFIQFGWEELFCTLVKSRMNQESETVPPRSDILAIDYSHKSFIILDKYTLRTKKWTHFRTIPIEFYSTYEYFGAELVDEKLYVLGGSDGNSGMRTVNKLNILNIYSMGIF